ncbi:BatA domain-containing protein [uncultured Microbulbifer sp.]|uniref:BatA domain-containing protein n=1 Tax=uncultured Microbulbifer sp. TaxID=348147 RepID=UPI002638FE33|nr:BatA domain-containing protein [uncultured Microbulbifer sp.]
MLWINSVFQSPQWLWLFAALALPIAIHLLRRSNPQKISFAALQWVQRYSQSRARRPIVDNKWLLLLRLLIVALLAFLLAQPLIERDIYPQKAVILVDPRIEAKAANAFIHNVLPQLASADANILWLSPETHSVTSPPPQNVDLWKTLSLLSGRADLRRAHILLINNTFPTSHSALRTSPHWQWHSLKKPVTAQNPVLPSIAVMGSAPSWWTPVLEDWRNTMPGLSVHIVEQEEALNTQQADWLIYAGPAPLPQAVVDFVADGGLLITDHSIQPPDHLSFARVDKSPSVQAAPLERGSWLRYESDWHSAAFYRGANLPKDLWQQWSTQDWPLQHRNRGLWSGTSAMGFPVADSAVENRRRQPLQPWLITALLVLLTLERLIALSRSPRSRTGEVHHG